ncbi:hypothetical protein Leryth_008701 [Lithospermum erythrorhizon]|nr:hypothetical protein Leryth_008701 [Lithospermum erythrorhizon]
MQSPIDMSHERVRIIQKVEKRSYKPANATISNRGHDIMEEEFSWRRDCRRGKFRCGSWRRDCKGANVDYGEGVVVGCGECGRGIMKGSAEDEARPG